jgi:hypothetical protein
MPLKLLTSMFVLGMLCWWLALQSNPAPNNWLVIHVPKVPLSAVLAKQLPKQCLEHSEMAVLQFQLDSQQLGSLQQTLRQLHDKNMDYFYQPLLDIVVPKAIGLDPMTFATSLAKDAVQVDRRVRRIELQFGHPATESGLDLIYDFTVSQTGEITMTANRTNLQKTSVPLEAIQNHNYRNDLERTPMWITDCMASALPVLRADLSWQFAPRPEEKGCELQGKVTEQVQLKFLASCPLP